MLTIDDYTNTNVQVIIQKKLRKVNKLYYESETKNFTLALTKCAFLRFHYVRGLALEFRSSGCRNKGARAVRLGARLYAARGHRPA